MDYNDFANFLYQNDHISLLIHARDCFQQAIYVTQTAKTMYDTFYTEKHKKISATTAEHQANIDQTQKQIELYQVNMTYMEDHHLITASINPSIMAPEELTELTQNKPCYLLFKTNIYLFDETHTIKSVKKTKSNALLFPTEKNKMMPIITNTPLSTTKKRASSSSSSSADHGILDNDMPYILTSLSDRSFFRPCERQGSDESIMSTGAAASILDCLST